MNISQLRYECPEWSWRAERRGMGWQYVGKRNGSRVKVTAVSVRCEPTEDDFVTEWVVDDGEHVAPYGFWWIHQEKQKT